MSRLRTFGMHSGLVLAAVLVALIVVEIGLRIAAPQQLIVPNAGVWQPDSLLGWRHRAGADLSINTGNRPARFRSDARGFRVGAETSPRDARYRVLLVGDSFVEGLMVDYEETFAGLLEQDLRAAGLDVEILNSGVSGWNPFQYARFAEALPEALRLDLALVFLYTANDFILPEDTLFAIANVGARHRLRRPRAFSQEELQQAVLYPINDFFETRSHLFVLLKNRSGRLLGRLGLMPYYFPTGFHRREASSPRWRFTARLCRRIESLFAARGVPVIFFLVPASFQVDEAEFYGYVEAFSIPHDSVVLEQPNRQLARQLPEAAGHTLIDLLAPLRARAAAGETLYGEVDRHLNEAGHRAVAEQIRPYVVQALQPSAEAR